MRLALGLVLVAAVVCMTGCAFTVAPVMPPMGFIYNNTEAPLDIDLNQTQMGSRTGEASTQCILGMFSWGDGSTAAAARAGGIKTIHYADYKSFNFLFIYSTYTTVVYGE